MKLMDFVNKEYFESDDKFNKCLDKLEEMRKKNFGNIAFCDNSYCSEGCVFRKWCKASRYYLDQFLVEEEIIKNKEEFFNYFIPSLILEYKNYKANKMQPSTLEKNVDEMQIGVPNNHYKSKIEPLEYIIENGFDFVRGNIIKYASRAGKKEGEEKNDIKKIIDYALILAKQENINIDFDELKKVIDYRKEWKK